MRYPAVFIRGGTSKGVFFHERDLPLAKAERDKLFLEIMGSPDPHGRQLNGMGGGLSSLSKVVIVEPSERADADIDYTFVQIAVDRPVADYGQACGNLSAAVGPFAVDEGLIEVADGEACVRVYVTNTEQIYHAHFDVKDGRTVESGPFVMAGVAGSGAPVRLRYLPSETAKPGAFLPSGKAKDTLVVKGVGDVPVTLANFANPLVLVPAVALGKRGVESPEVLERAPGFMQAMDAIRTAGAVSMGLVARAEEVALSVPKVAIVSSPADYVASDGQNLTAQSHDIGVRIVSMGRVHRAITGTGAMCLAAACQVEGSVAEAASSSMGATVRMATPSGVMEAQADVFHDACGGWRVNAVTVTRTQRRLMEGWVRAEFPHAHK